MFRRGFCYLESIKPVSRPVVWKPRVWTCPSCESSRCPPPPSPMESSKNHVQHFACCFVALLEGKAPYLWSQGPSKANRGTWLLKKIARNTQVSVGLDKTLSGAPQNQGEPPAVSLCLLLKARPFNPQPLQTLTCGFLHFPVGWFNGFSIKASPGARSFPTSKMYLYAHRHIHPYLDMDPYPCMHLQIHM